jgi:hypothetical protein
MRQELDQERVPDYDEATASARNPSCPDIRIQPRRPPVERIVRNDLVTAQAHQPHVFVTPRGGVLE